MPKPLNLKRGFTLLETFVAITILIIAVIGPLSLMIRGITDGNYAKNEVTAFYLAQEGLELVINQRDANQFSTGASDTDNYTWLRGLTPCFSDSADDLGCKIEIGEQVATPCNGNDGCGLFKFSDGSPNQANFSRKINIITGVNQITGTLAGETEPIDEDLQTQHNQAEVIVTITWNNKAAPRSLVLKDIIYERQTQQ